MPVLVTVALALMKLNAENSALWRAGVWNTRLTADRLS